MMKKLAILLALMMAAILLFAACGEDDKPVEEHVHDYGTLIAEVPATCTTAGTEAHYHCSGCNKDFDSNKNEITNLVIPAFGHTPLTDKAVAATCEEDGKTEGKHCAICGEVIVAQQTIPATGHTDVVDEAVAATCTATGKAEGKHCSVCGKVLVAQQIIPATGHTEVIDEGRPATCTENGVTEGKHCSVCNEVIVAQEVIPAGHTFGEWVKGTPATCEADGTKGYFYCSVCEKYFDKDGETEITDFVIPTPGHDYKLLKEAAPTCSTAGAKAHYHCEACGKDFDEDYNEVTAESLAIPATGHTWTHLYVEKVDPISCTEPGMKAHYYCPECGKYFDAKKKAEVSAEDLILTIAHSFGPLIAEVPASCEADGVVAHYHCSVCEKNFDKDKNEISDLTIPALGHTYQQTGELTKKGNSYVISCHCPTCGKNIDAEYKMTANFRRFLYEDGVCTGISPADDSTLEAHYYCAELDKYMSLDLKEITVADLKPANVIGIYDNADMAAFAAMVNDGKTFAGENIALCADVELNTKIGYTGSSNDRKPFSGNFDGQGYTVTITQSFSNPDGDGGLFSFVRVPENGTVTIKNVHITGTISLINSKTGCGYTGGLISAVDAGKSGDGGTLNITNVWSTVRINAGLANAWNSLGGFIGFIRHEAGVKPITINIDSCVWEGVINCGPALYHGGGFIGYTGNNQPGRQPVINITNSIASGTFMLNIDWNQQFGALVSYAKGSFNDDATAKVTINISNVISMVKATFAKATGSGSTIGLIEEVSGTTELNMTNVYYIPFNRKGVEGEFPVVAAGEASTLTNVLKKTYAEIFALTADDFTNAESWSITGGVNGPCPKGIYDTFGQLESLQADPFDLYDEFEIGTTEEFLEFRDTVNGGQSFAGKTVKLTADIDLEGIAWVSIGDPGSTKSANCKSFCGTFDGQGHTISNMTTFLEPTSGYADMQGGLFASLGDGAVVKNFTLTGTYTVHNVSTATGTTDYFGSVANAVKGTVLIQNVHSSVDFKMSTGKNSAGNWPGAIERVGGIVGFIYHDCSADLTIDGCEYSGTINTANQGIDYAGIMAFTGNNTNSSTKTVTISNCAFTGRMTFNENSAYAMQGIAGIISHVKGATVTITNTHSDGKIYFNGTKDWPIVDGDSNPIKMGQILGYNEDGSTVNIDSTVTYNPASLLQIKDDEGSKYVLPEAGRLNGVYAADTAAVMAVDPE